MKSWSKFRRIAADLFFPRHPAAGKDRRSRGAPHEYPRVQVEDRPFYEMVSDIIAQIRDQIGDRALTLATGIDGLVIDPHTGRVLKMTKDPTEIIALLVYRYETSLGRRVSFVPKVLEKDQTSILRPLNQNIKIVEKYFSKH